MISYYNVDRSFYICGTLSYSGTFAIDLSWFHYKVRTVEGRVFTHVAAAEACPIFKMPDISIPISGERGRLHEPTKLFRMPLSGRGSMARIPTNLPTVNESGQNEDDILTSEAFITPIEASFYLLDRAYKSSSYM